LIAVGITGCVTVKPAWSPQPLLLDNRAKQVKILIYKFEDKSKVDKRYTIYDNNKLLKLREGTRQEMFSKSLIEAFTQDGFVLEDKTNEIFQKYVFITPNSIPTLIVTGEIKLFEAYTFPGIGPAYGHVITEVSILDGSNKEKLWEGLVDERCGESGFGVANMFVAKKNAFICLDYALKKVANEIENKVFIFLQTIK